ncbi:MAG: carbon-nitrogen hydrolase family protein [Planctomycetota bacterium]
MRVGLCQFRSPQSIDESIRGHVRAAEQAADLGCSLALFPELSLTGYGLSVDSIEASSPVLDPLAAVSSERGMHLAVGVPLPAAEGGTEIGMVLFQPDGSRRDYAKQLLHESETCSFEPGTRDMDVFLKGRTIAFGICYEAMQPSHGSAAIARGATVYAASVAKHAAGMADAHRYLAAFAESNRIPTLIVNAVGPADGFECSGGSAAWDASGSLIRSLGPDERVMAIDIG